jgi:protein-tyrosine phosphatase
VSRVTWQGAFNLRDLGGLPLTGGGLTALGRVYRSGAPEWMTERGWGDARDAGLTTIVDLRNAPSETERLPHHPVIDAAVTKFASVISTPTEDPDDGEFMSVCGPWLDHPRSYADNLAFYPKKFAAVFTAIASSDGGVLVHCSGGKDRTGMVVAMLLTLAGVETDAIVADYEAAFRTANAAMLANPTLHRHFATTDDELDAWMIERTAALREWLYGLDVEAYLRDAGVSAATLERLGALLR